MSNAVGLIMPFSAGSTSITLLSSVTHTLSDNIISLDSLCDNPFIFAIVDAPNLIVTGSLYGDRYSKLTGTCTLNIRYGLSSSADESVLLKTEVICEKADYAAGWSATFSDYRYIPALFPSYYYLTSTKITSSTTTTTNTGGPQTSISGSYTVYFYGFS
jgi:hypothetical protein